VCEHAHSVLKMITNSGPRKKNKNPNWWCHGLVRIDMVLFLILNHDLKESGIYIDRFLHKLSAGIVSQ